jgi:hypothetical protein
MSEKVLYKPLGLAFSVLGGIVAGAVFRQVWMHLSGETDPPNPTDSRYGWKEVVVAAAAEGAIFGLVKAAIDRAGARGYERITGVWPGE